MYKSVSILLLLAVPILAEASDFTALIVIGIAILIALALLVLAFVSIGRVMSKVYVKKNPGTLVGSAGVLLAVGTISLLSEASHMGTEDFAFFLAVMLIPGALAIIPPLVQHYSANKR